MPRMSYYNGTDWVRACKARMIENEAQDMNTYEVDIFKSDEYIYGTKNVIETNLGETANTSYYSFAYIDCFAQQYEYLNSLCANAIADLLCNNCGFTLVSYANIYYTCSDTNYARITKGNIWITIYYSSSECRTAISNVGSTLPIISMGYLGNKFAFYLVGDYTRVHIKFFSTKNGGNYVISMFTANQGLFIFCDFNCYNMINPTLTLQYGIRYYSYYLIDDMEIWTYLQRAEELHGMIHPLTKYTCFASSQTGYFMSKLILKSEDSYLVTQSYLDAHRDYYRYYINDVYSGAYVSTSQYELFTINSQKFVRQGQIIYELN